MPRRLSQPIAIGPDEATAEIAVLRVVSSQLVRAGRKLARAGRKLARAGRKLARAGRKLAQALVLVSGAAHAEPVPETTGTTSSVTPEDVGDQGVGAEIGIATGGRVTPGGLRLAGHYLYQLSSDDWFDGSASFTYGGGSAACFRDRMDATVCDHGLADGGAVEISANVRRVFARQGSFRPFVRAGAGIAIVRFPDDGVSGVAFPLHAGGGLRTLVAPSIAVVAQGDLELGFGAFNQELGLEPQLGVSISAGAEFILR